MYSVTDIFKVGIGPSSSHTVGPMRAAAEFVAGLEAGGLLPDTVAVTVVLYGSLAWTGRGHGTDRAVMLGLCGAQPDTIEPDDAERLITGIEDDHRLALGGHHMIEFDPAARILFDRTAPTPHHPNTLALIAFGADGGVLLAERWCSVGGGFVIREGETPAPDTVTLPYPFDSAAGLLAQAETAGLTIAQLMRSNEAARHPGASIEAAIDRIARIMFACIERGLAAEGELPGGLRVRRRARDLARRLQERAHTNLVYPHAPMDWVGLWAIAVNEENAAGGRVVTAPTNGAAGVIPAVLRYYRDLCPDASTEGIRTFLLTATAIGSLCKLNASISGAEVGCQGEVGSACAMAAGGLAAALGGTNAQIENAAEIGMEHHLGMTCDPVGGLVQIPCIERNAFGAVKAIAAASLALNADGTHRVSLDQVIRTMRQTGADMLNKYKETSQGGLAVNFTEC